MRCSAWIDVARNCSHLYTASGFACSALTQSSMICGSMRGSSPWILITMSNSCFSLVAASWHRSVPGKNTQHRAITIELKQLKAHGILNLTVWAVRVGHDHLCPSLPASICDSPIVRCDHNKVQAGRLLGLLPGPYDHGLSKYVNQRLSWESLRLIAGWNDSQLHRH